MTVWRVTVHSVNYRGALQGRKLMAWDGVVPRVDDHVDDGGMRRVLRVVWEPKNHHVCVEVAPSTDEMHAAGVPPGLETLQAFQEIYATYGVGNP